MTKNDVQFESDLLRVKDLPLGTCFSKEGHLMVKLQGGYCLDLGNFVQYQVRSQEHVERVFDRVTVVAKNATSGGNKERGET